MSRVTIRTDARTAARFFAFLAAEYAMEAIAAAPLEQPREPAPRPLEKAAPGGLRRRRTGVVACELFGESHVSDTSIDALAAILAALAQRFPDRMARIAAAVSGRSRPYIGRCGEALHIGRADLARRSREFAPGWFLDEVISNQTKQKLVEKACGVLGLTFGRDVKVRFPNV